MAAGTHPFFLDVATQVGKLIKLNGLANRSQIKRRMTEAWGDRSTLERTIQHVLRSLTQWGLLRAGHEHGSLIGPAQRIYLGDEVSQLLVHSVLLGQGNGLHLPQLIAHPALFPFAPHLTIRTFFVAECDLSCSTSRRSVGQAISRTGDQSDLIELA